MSDNNASHTDAGWGSPDDVAAVDDPMSMATDAEEIPSGRFGGMSRNAKRALIAAVVTGCLVLVAGVTVLAVLLAFGLPGGKPTTPPVSSASAPAPSPTLAAKLASGDASAPMSASVPIVEVSNSDVYQARDPFQPLLEVIPPKAVAAAPSSAATTVTSSSTSTSSSPSVPTTTTQPGPSPDASGTLTLRSIVMQHGVRKAVLSLDGVTYTLAAGQRLSTTSWEVFEVGADYCVMLFGDDKITLTLGQAIAH